MAKRPAALAGTSAVAAALSEEGARTTGDGSRGSAPSAGGSATARRADSARGGVAVVPCALVRAGDGGEKATARSGRSSAMGAGAAAPILAPRGIGAAVEARAGG